jgi:thymidine kinase
MPIFVHTGPMFSGKSGSLVEGVKRRIIGKQKQGHDFLVFNHKSDKRYGEKVLASHNGIQVTADPIESSTELLENLFELKEGKLYLKDKFKNLRALYLDEAQFFDNKMGEVLELIDQYFLHTSNYTFEILVAGLDLDFRGEPFGPMPDIFARSHQVTKHMAVCSICGENKATKTQRLIEGKPAGYNDPVVLVGAKDAYTSRCDKHHQIPGKPKRETALQIFPQNVD